MTLLSAGIMAIPKRANHVVNYLQPELIRQGLHVQVSWDTHTESPATPHLWQNARRAWTCWTGESTHHLHIQDDAKLCTNFVAGVYKLIDAVPDQVISLFLSDRDVIQRAVQNNVHWVECTGVCWGLANVMPIELLREFLEWEEKHVVPFYKHDDGRLEMWAQMTGRKIWLAVPMLVEHLGAMRSALGQSMKTKVAAEFLEGDPLEIDWNDLTHYRLNEPIPRDYLNKWLTGGIPNADQT